MRPLGLHREDQARPHCRAVDQDGAGPAHAVLAAELGAGEAAVLAQEVGQRPPRPAPSTGTREPAPHRGIGRAARRPAGPGGVRNVETKKPADGTVRGRAGPATPSCASSATATAGSSAAGSAWAIDPPTVPRLR